MYFFREREWGRWRWGRRWCARLRFVLRRRWWWDTGCRAREGGPGLWRSWGRLRKSVGPPYRSSDRWLTPWPLRCTLASHLRVEASSRCSSATSITSPPGNLIKILFFFLFNLIDSEISLFFFFFFSFFWYVFDLDCDKEDSLIQALILLFGDQISKGLFLFSKVWIFYFIIIIIIFFFVYKFSLYNLIYLYFRDYKKFWCLN